MAIRLSLKKRKQLAITYFILTTIVLLWPGNALPKTKLVTIPYFDKIVHIGLFACLAWLLLRAYGSVQKSRNIRIMAGIIGYGVAIEFIQLYLIPFRSFEFVDILADSIGAILGMALFHKTRKHLP
jgi:VanZ family protein